MASGGGIRVRAAGGTLVAVVAWTGCYHHGTDPRPPPADSFRALRLPAPAIGAYEVVGPTGQRGDEHFTITATGGHWTLVSRRTMPHGEEGFRLQLDAATTEPTSFRLWRRFDDIEQSVRGHREAEWLVIRRDGPMPGTRRIAYAPGTIIDAPTPTFKAPALALLRDALRSEGQAVVRTLRFDGAFFAGRVVLTTLERRGRSGDVDLVRLSRADERPAGLWVRQDGWPTRMKVLGERRRAAWQWRLRTSTASAAAGE